MNYDNRHVVERLQKKHGMSYKQACSVFQDTKRFLYMCGTIPGQWTPPDTIDIGWHEFGLFMKEYEDFCIKHFAHFIYHKPATSDQPSDPNAPKYTLQVATNLFGEGVLGENWYYLNEKGKPVLGPGIEKIGYIVLGDCSPGDSCGCGPGCSDPQ
ncbi:MAG TPA: hypothetical protein VFM02_03980 [Candidatus Paceibacterota bacterium]|nr:hypothetical protein [Candidatus Paceibacterota bacterium]